MRLLLDVIADLYYFALGAVYSLVGRAPSPKPLLSARTELPMLSTRAVHELDAVHADEITTTPTTFRNLTDIIAEKHIEPMVLGPQGTYYVSSDEALVFLHPTKEFDGAQISLRYGESVTVLGHAGKFAQVQARGVLGYIAREDLTDRAAFVYPEFVVGEGNDVDDPATVRLRAIIDDTFLGGMLEYPLQAGEYVLYRLLRRGITIPWPNVRPRIPGRWHVLLRGALSVHSGVTPKTGSVMEYVLENDIGHLAYVEAVFPNETIMISEVNYPDSGVYNERTLTHEEWRELKPVFIHIV